MSIAELPSSGMGGGGGLRICFDASKAFSCVNVNDFICYMISKYGIYMTGASDVSFI